jgi:hypothetical protein
MQQDMLVLFLATITGKVPESKQDEFLKDVNNFKDIDYQGLDKVCSKYDVDMKETWAKVSVLHITNVFKEFKKMFPKEQYDKFSEELYGRLNDNKLLPTFEEAK